MEPHAEKGCLKLKAGKYRERQIAVIIASWGQPPMVHIEAIQRHEVIGEQHRSRDEQGGPDLGQGLGK